MTTTTTDAVKGAEGRELKQLLTLCWYSEHGVTWDVFPSTWTVWLREHQQKTSVMCSRLQIILQIFNKKYLQNLKRACIFHLINGQNLLGVTKVICQQSLTCMQWCPLKKTLYYLYYHGDSINKLNCFSQFNWEKSKCQNQGTAAKINLCEYDYEEAL